MIFPIGKIWLKKPNLKQQTGAAVVEFTLALMGLLGFFAIYMLFVQIFIAHEQTVFAGFAAARKGEVSYAVKGSGPAKNTAVEIDPGAAVTVTASKVLIKRNVQIPAGIDRFFTGGRGRFPITHGSPMFIDRLQPDDNPSPF